MLAVVIFLTWVLKLPVDDKITACVKEKCVLGIACKVPYRKASSGETFCFPEKCLLPRILNFVLRVTYCFLRAADWPTTNFLGMCC